MDISRASRSSGGCDRYTLPATADSVSVKDAKHPCHRLYHPQATYVGVAAPTNRTIQPTQKKDHLSEALEGFHIRGASERHTIVTRRMAIPVKDTPKRDPKTETPQEIKAREKAKSLAMKEKRKKRTPSGREGRKPKAQSGLTLAPVVQSGLKTGPTVQGVLPWNVEFATQIGIDPGTRTLVEELSSKLERAGERIESVSNAAIDKMDGFSSVLTNAFDKVSSIMDSSTKCILFLITTVVTVHCFGKQLRHEHILIMMGFCAIIAPSGSAKDISDLLHRIVGHYRGEDQFHDCSEPTVQGHLFGTVPSALVAELVTVVLGTVSTIVAPKNKMRVFIDSFAKIPQSAKGVEVALEVILNLVQDIIYATVGSRVDLLSATDKEVKTWIDKVTTLYAQAADGSLVVDSANCRVVVGLKVSGNELLSKCERNNIRDSTMLRTWLRTLDDVMVPFQQANFTAGLRVEPFMILLRGESGVGKSHVISPLIHSLLAATLPSSVLSHYCQNPTDYVYSRQPEHKYWDAYTGQFATVFDDFGQVTDIPGGGDTEYMDIIRCGNKFPNVLHMAHLNSKGQVPFTSKLVIGTTNLKHIQPLSISQPEAVNRRWDVVVDIVPAVAYCKEGTGNGMPEDRRLDVSKCEGDLDLNAYEFRLMKLEAGTTGSFVHSRTFGFQDFKQYLITGYNAKMSGGTGYIGAIEDWRQKELAERFARDNTAPGEPVAQSGLFGGIKNAIFGSTDLPYVIRLNDGSPEIRLNDGSNEASLDDPSAPAGSVELPDIRLNDGMSKEARHKLYTFYFNQRESLVVHEGVDYPFVHNLRLMEYINRGINGWDTETPQARKVLLHLLSFDEGCVNHDTMEIKAPSLDESLVLCDLFITALPAFSETGLIAKGLETFKHLHNVSTEKAAVMLLACGKLPVTTLLCFCEGSVPEGISGIPRPPGLDQFLQDVKCKMYRFANMCGMFPVNIAHRVNCIIHSNPMTSLLEQIADAKRVFDNNPLLRIGTYVGAGLLLSPLILALWRWFWPSESSGLKQSPLRLARKRWFQRHHMQEAAPEGMIDPTSMDIARSVLDRNTYVLYSSMADYETNKQNSAKAGVITMISGTIGMTARHYYFQLKKCVDDGVWDMSHKLILGKWGTQRYFEVPVSSFLDDSSMHVEKDLMFIKFPNNVPRASDIRKFFLTEDIMMKNKDMAAYLHVPQSICTSAITHIVAKPLGGALSITQVDGTKELTDDVFSYKAATRQGDCGSLIFLQNPASSHHKIMGLHIAGMDNDRGFASFVFRDELDEQMIILGNDIHEQANITPIPRDLPVAGSFMPLETVPEFFPKYSKTKLTPTPLYEAWGPNTKFPAHLTPVKKDGDLICPREKAMEGYSTHCKYIRDKPLQAALSAVTAHVINTVQGRKDVLSFETACAGEEGNPYRNSAPRGTSAGYPYCMYPKIYGKKKYGFFGEEGDYSFTSDNCVQLKVRCEKIIAAAQEGTRLRHVYVDFLKDERRPSAKNDAVSTRLISACPLDYLVVFRMYFGAFIASMMECRIVNSCAVGINPFSAEWENLAKYLTSKGPDLFAGDFKGFDRDQSAQILGGLIKPVNTWYDDGPENARIRRVLWLEITQSRHLFGNTVYEWDHSLPSGHPMTSIVNSLYVMMVFHLAWIEAHDGDINSLAEFKANVNLIAYGDDNVVNVTPYASTFFNQITVPELILRSSNMVYTDENKGSCAEIATRSIEEVTFLKRGWRFDDRVGRRVAPLSLETILEMPYWSRDRGALEDSARVNSENALSEVSLHGQGVFDDVGTTILRAMQDRLNVRPIRDSWETWLDFTANRDSPF